MNMLRCLTGLSARGATDLLSADSSSIQPCGATEQHGDQLSVGSDTIIADRIAIAGVDGLEADPELWLLPALPAGNSNEHAWRPETVSLSTGTLCSLLNDIGRAVAATPAFTPLRTRR